jgi:hypothetical protein
MSNGPAVRRPGVHARARRSIGPVSTVLCLMAGLFGVQAQAANQQVPAPLSERTRGAERVVVGRVVSVKGVWQENEYGDRLIVSVVRVTVDETLKGQPQQELEIEVEGGTIGDLTLRVSDLPAFTQGERAVFYLTRSPRGTFVPYMRGQGLLKLDRFERVAGSAVTLEQIRRAAASQVPGTPR